MSGDELRAPGGMGQAVRAIAGMLLEMENDFPLGLTTCEIRAYLRVRRGEL